MSFATTLLFFAYAAFAQNQAAAPAAAPPAASTQTVVAVSSGAPDAQGHGLKTAGAPPVAVLSNPITVRIQKESADWDPVSVRVGGDPGQASNSFRWRIKRKGGKASKATAVARVHPHKDDKMLIVALYPVALKKRGIHFEVRCLVSEGLLDEVKVAAVTVKADPRYHWGAEDTFTLAKKGIEFSEDFPSEGNLKISALNPKPGKASRNSGVVTGADFGGKSYGNDDLHVVSFSYGTTGVIGPSSVRAGVPDSCEAPRHPVRKELRKGGMALLDQGTDAFQAGNSIKADDLFRKACEQRDCTGCYDLGTSYERGDGVSRDYSLAAEFYRKACALRSYLGCRDLADLYAKGMGVAQDSAQAAEFYGKACRLGLQESCAKAHP